MASLLSWAKKKVKGVEQTINRDVVHPVVQHTQAAVAQVNPVDNGRTYNSVMQRGSAFAPKPPSSVIHQATHNGLTNVVGGSVVKPLVRTSTAINQGFANAELKLAGRPTLNAQQFQTQTGIPKLQKFSGYTGTKRQIAGDVITNMSNIAAPGSSKLLESGVTKVLPKVAPKIVPKVVASSVTGGLVGAPSNVGAYLAGPEPLTKKGFVSAAKTGAEFGAAGGAVLPVAGAVAPKLAKGSVSAAKAVNAESKAAVRRNAMDTAHDIQQTKIDRAVKSYTKQYRQNQARGYSDNHPAQVNIRKALKELDQRQLNITPSASRTARQKVTDKLFGGIGLSTNAVDKNGFPVGPTAKGGSSANLHVPENQSTAGIKLVNSTSEPSLLPSTLTPKAIEPPVPPVKTASAAPPIIPPESRLATLQPDAPNPGTPGPVAPQATSRFTGKTVPGSQYVSGGVKEKLNAPTYTVQQEKANYTASLSKLKDQGQEQFVANAEEALNKPHGTISRQEATDAITAAQMLDGANDPASLARASDIYDKLSSHYTAAGQLTQSAAILARRTPQGLLYDSMRQLKRSGAQITPELQSKLASAIDEFKRAPSAKRDYAAAKVRKLVADNTPQGNLDKLTSVWKAGLLSGVKTQQGNAISNGTFAALKKISDVPAAAIDKGISLFTGQRTKTLTGRGTLQGTREGIVNAKDTLKTGLDKRNITEGKYQQHGELNFKNPVINKVFGKTTNLVFRSMSAADQPFYYAAAKNSLYDQAIALAKTKGVTGAERTAFVKKMVDNPSQSMAETARAEAEKAVLGYDTAGSKIIQGGLNAVDRSNWSPAGKSFVRHAVNVLAPFVKVPSAFISRTIDFTPAGPFKEAIRQISNKQFDQRALSQAIGEGLTGTGAIALGIALSQHNLISGDYPKNDPKEVQRWKAEGITPNSVKLGNNWYSLNYLGPLGLLFNAGHEMHQSGSQGGATTVGAALGGLGQGLLGQSFLQGLSGFSDAITNPEQNAKSYINSQASSAVPAWVNDIANVTDKSQRQADSVPQAIKNRIPGLRETNNVKQDVYGNPLAQPAGQLNTLNGIKPSNSLTKRNPVITEVSRLHNVDPKNADLQVTPTQVDKTVTVEKKKVNLSDQQRYDLQNKIGQATQAEWGKLIKTPEYKALDDTGKAKALSSLRTDVATLQTRQFVLDNNLGAYTKSPSKSIQALGEGTANLANYTERASSGGDNLSISKYLPKGYAKVLSTYGSMSSTDRTKAFNKTNNAEYLYDKAKFENDKANGTLSTAQRIKTANALKKEKVGSNYPKNIRDLYELSIAELKDYLTTDQNGQAQYDQLKAYDKALVDAGIKPKSKFKYGLDGAAGKSGGGSSKGNAFLANLKYEAAIKPPTVPNMPKPGKLAAPRQVALKKFTPKKYAISKGSKVSVRKGIA